jgi:hypothetical protein
VYCYGRQADGGWQENLLADHASVAAVLSVDSQASTLYCAWLRDNTLHVKMLENGNWVDVNIEKAVVASPSAFSVFYRVTDGKLGVAVLDKLPEPETYKLYYFVMGNL